MLVSVITKHAKVGKAVVNIPMMNRPNDFAMYCHVDMDRLKIIPHYNYQFNYAPEPEYMKKIEKLYTKLKNAGFDVELRQDNQYSGETHVDIVYFEFKLSSLIGYFVEPYDDYVGPDQYYDED